MMEETLSKAVKDFRLKVAGETQVEFAKSVGVSTPLVCAIEKGFRPSLRTYEKLAQSMGVEAKFLRELKTKGDK